MDVDVCPTMVEQPSCTAENVDRPAPREGPIRERGEEFHGSASCRLGGKPVPEGHTAIGIR